MREFLSVCAGLRGLFFLFFWSLGLVLFGQTTIYSESFSTWSNGAPQGWTLQSQGPSWAPADSLPASSRPAISGCDFSGSFLRFPSSQAQSGQISSLISPSLNLSSYLGASLEVQMCLVNPGPALGEGDGISLYVSDDNGQSWTLLGSDSAWYGAWTTLSWSIPTALLSTQVRIRIDGFGHQALLDVGIDRVRVVNPAPPCLAQNSSISGNLPAFVCRDQVSDPVTLSHSFTGNSNYAYLLTDPFDYLLQVLPSAQFDANIYAPGEYRIYGVSFIGALLATTNQPIQLVTATGCAILSQNSLSMNVVELVLSTTVTSDYSGFAVSGSGETDGSATVQVTGGSGAYAYLWSAAPGVNSPTASNLPGGPQLITITDSLTGCAITDTLDLLTPPELVLRLLPAITYGGAMISCAGQQDAALQAVIEGGVPPYTLFWSHDASLRSSFVDSLGPGTYEITVTDANGLTRSESLSISAPSPLLIYLDQRKPSCEGNRDGALILSGFGGTGTRSWRWNHGPTSSSLFGLSTGEYRVTMTDQNGCEISESYQIERAEAPVILANATNPVCFGDENGQVSLEVIAGEAPFVHLWDHGPMGPMIQNLRPGTYRVFTSDANGCRDTAEVTLVSSPLLRVVVNSTPDGGANSGTASAVVKGGVEPYLFQWSSGGSLIEETGLAGGNYLLMVTDANGCVVQEPFEIALSDAPDCLAQDMGFSPNFDGINDFWELPCIARYEGNEVQVFNRWGQRLFFSLDYQQNWDGRSQGEHLPVGTYYYIVRLLIEGNWREYKGTLSIVR